MSKRIIVSVLGGVTEVISNPDELEIVILDFDNGDSACVQCGRDIADQVVCPYCEKDQAEL